MIPFTESRYNQWVQEHYRFLLRSAWALTGSRALAEDVVQDCFTSAWRFRHQLRDATMARAWLFQIMRRHAFRHMVPAAHLVSGDEDLLEHCQDESATSTSTLDDQLDVVKALARIAPIHREVLVLHYFDDMPTAQMAEALEIAPGTVLSRLARAREALKTALVATPGTHTRPSSRATSGGASVIALGKR